MGIQRFSAYTRTSYSIRFMGKSATWVYSGSRRILERVIQSGSWANLLHGYTAVLVIYWNELFNQVHGHICYMGIQRFSAYTGTSYSTRFMGKSATWVYSGSRHILERVIQSGLISISNTAIIYTTFELIACMLYLCYKHGYTFSKNGNRLKLPFRSKFINFIENSLKLTYFIIHASNEGTCVEFWRKKQFNLGLPTSTNNRVRLTR